MRKGERHDAAPGTEVECGRDGVGGCEPERGLGEQRAGRSSHSHDMVSSGRPAAKMVIEVRKHPPVGQRLVCADGWAPETRQRHRVERDHGAQPGLVPRHQSEFDRSFDTKVGQSQLHNGRGDRLPEQQDPGESAECGFIACVKRTDSRCAHPAETRIVGRCSQQ